jgi:ribosome production factor 1
MAYSSVPTGFKPKNKLRRQAAYLNIKKNREAEKRDSRLRRRREEDKDPSLREERHATHVPVTIDSKRVWDDDPVGDEEDALGWAVDVERLAKRRKLEQEQIEADGGEEGVLAKLKKLEEEKADNDSDEEMDEDADSMLDSDEELEDSASDSDSDAASRKKRASSPSASVATTNATNMELSPEFLKTKFP